jgi:poly(A) polymerase
MSETESMAAGVVRRLREAGHVAYYAGGCVRDMLRGVEPTDYDIATSARPEEVQRLFPRTVAVGAHFGVICVLDRGRQFEVATFRSDGAYIDGRHPAAVTFSSPREDAERRDFTVNGMFYDPLATEVIDFVGGRADLDRRLLRAIGDAPSRFREDRLRMLRAIRFATVLGFEIDPPTWQAIEKQAPEIHDVSAERIRDELVRIFLHPNRVRGLDLLDQSGLLAQTIPEMLPLKGCEQPPQFHPEGDVWVHTRRMLELLPAQVSIPLVFSVLLHDIGKPPTFSIDPAEGRIRFNAHDKVGAAMARAIMERLRFSRDEIEATVEAVDQHMVFKDVQHMRVARLKRFMARPNFPEELELHRVDCQSSHAMLDNYDFLRAKQEAFANEPLIPPPLVTGDDLIAMGWTPGPKFKEVLDAVQTRQLEQTLKTREEALAWLKSEYPNVQ